ncbi:MAG: DUF975 family protein [Chitinispirillaceae bacterium]|nr:DUF975 family protein [Chitinispirillaceae bacterium]
MLTENQTLMTRARESLKGNWGIVVGVTLVYFLITAIAGSPKFIKIAGFIIGGPMALGYQIFFLSLIRRKNITFGMLFEGFNNFLTALGAYVLMIIFVILWLLLLIVPGIIAAMSYSLTWFIIADNPAIGPLEAIRKSKQMMMGHKWKLFYLSCRFWAWILLGFVTAGIGFLWIGPYMMASFAHFYQDLLDNAAVASSTDGQVRTLPTDGVTPDAPV